MLFIVIAPTRLESVSYGDSTSDVEESNSFTLSLTMVYATLYVCEFECIILHRVNIPCCVYGKFGKCGVLRCGLLAIQTINSPYTQRGMFKMQLKSTV